ncbi:hypothetical protein ACHHYP_05163 [Achlya hypogyna]|uniref:Uncharacterized protein n=1 Tax=Achlya hypogyna TaxID=1202772 RepID=A0A1V9ZNV0_ACHHY|nr:hypothetical protein ACHHYP_05163 [Achlya hypogyna]
MSYHDLNECALLKQARDADEVGDVATAVANYDKAIDVLQKRYTSLVHGLMVAGPLGCVAGAVGGAILTTKDGASGDIARATGNLVVASFDKAKHVNETYHVTDRVKGAVKCATATAHEIDAKYKIKDKAGSWLDAGIKHASQVNQKYRLTDRATEATVTGMNTAAKMLRDSGK